MNGLAPSAILIIDDDVDHAQIARLVPGVPVEVCRDAATAFSALDGQPRGALVLVERVLGGVESFDSVVRMHGARPDVTVVMLSAALSSIDRAYALACGAADAIEKPADLAGWRAMLGALVGTVARVPRAA